MKGLHKICRLLFPIVLFSFCLNAWSQSSAYPDIEPLFVANEAATYTADELFQTALLYSECQPNSENWNRCINLFEKIKAQIITPQTMALSEEERGKTILKLLYEVCLSRYSALQTKVDVAIQTGEYNCVSSAILYMALAKAAGLQIKGQKTSEHAFCSVYIPVEKSGQSKKIDVETTNPYGFNPGSKEAVMHENEIKGYYIVPKTYYSNRKEVTDSLFAGLIAGNLCSYYLDHDDYNSAVPLGAARYLAVSNQKNSATQDVRKEFDILAANYVNIIPESAAAFLDTVKWFCSFIDRWGITTFLQTNMDNAINNFLVLTYEEQDFDLAYDGWLQSKKYVSANKIQSYEEMLVDTLVISTVEALPPEEQLSYITKLLEEDPAAAQNQLLTSTAARNRLGLHLENVWLGILNNYINNREYKTGYEVSSQALEQLPKSSKIKTMQKNFYNNCIAIIHNEFAGLANSGKYSEAKEVLEQGLAVYPEDKTLKNDMSLLLKRMQ